VYFVFMIVAIIGEFLLPNPVVRGDATATAQNLASGELTYRIGILLDFLTHFIFIYLVVILYRLFEDVDKSNAMLLVLLVSVGVAVALANLLQRFAPLVLLGGDDYLSVFTKQQLDALALNAVGLRRSGAAYPMLFWGLWLFPFGIMVIKSGFLPRILGILQLIAGCGYLITGAVSIVFPDQSGAVSKFMMPLYFGEVPIIFWLLIKGVAEPQQEMRAPMVG